jgi:molecular chaperone DnaK
MYSAQQQAGEGAQGSADSGDNGADDVVDAEFEEVKDDDKRA